MSSLNGMQKKDLTALLKDTTKEEKMIKRFSGRYAFLSNFYPTPVRLGGIEFQNSEAAFQAAKSLDPRERIITRAVKPRTLVLGI